MLVSAVQQSESATCIHISPPSLLGFPSTPKWIFLLVSGGIRGEQGKAIEVAVIYTGSHPLIPQGIKTTLSLPMRRLYFEGGIAQVSYRKQCKKISFQYQNVCISLSSIVSITIAFYFLIST